MLVGFRRLPSWEHEPSKRIKIKNRIALDFRILVFINLLSAENTPDLRARKQQQQFAKFEKVGRNRDLGFLLSQIYRKRLNDFVRKVWIAIFLSQISPPL